MNYNKYFEIQERIGIDLTEEEYQCLLAEGRIFCTSTRLNRAEAVAIMGGDPMRFAEDEREYGGSIVVSSYDNWDEAKKIAEERGWGESVDGLLIDNIPYEERETPIYRFGKHQEN